MLSSCSVKMSPIVSHRVVYHRVVFTLGFAIMFISALVFFISNLYSSSDICQKVCSEGLSWQEEWFTKPSESPESPKRGILLVCGGLILIALLPLLSSSKAYGPNLPHSARLRAQEVYNVIVYCHVVISFSILLLLYHCEPEYFFSTPAQCITIDGCEVKCFIGYGAFMWFNGILYLFAFVFSAMIYQSLISLPAPDKIPSPTSDRVIV